MNSLTSGLLIVLILAACQTSSDSPDYIVTRFMKECEVPGAFVAVVKDDSVLYQKGFGMADMERSIPFTDKTCTELGSVSKAFTAEIIYSLHHSGHLNIDDAIIKYLPEAPDSWSEITIRHLLCHTSGIQNYLSDPRFRSEEYFKGIKNPDTERFFNRVPTDSMVQLFYTLPVEFIPGSGWSYSNTGYYLLGKIIEVVSGRNYFEIVRDSLTTILYMQQTMANESALEENCLATGYYKNSDGWHPSHVLTGNYAFSAGAWATSGQDMIRYLKAVHERNLPSDMTGYNWRNIDSNSDLPFTYEGGRFYTTYHGMKIISHNGGTPGFSSSWIYVVDNNISIIVLINRQDLAAVDQVAWEVLASFETSLKYPDRNITGDEEESYARKVSEIIRAIDSGTHYPDELTPSLRTFMESGNGRGMWKWYFERGMPDSAYCVDAEMIGAWKAYRFVLHSESVRYRMTVLTNPVKEIVQVRWW